MERGKMRIIIEAPPNGYKSTMALFLRKAIFDAFDAAVVDVVDGDDKPPWSRAQADRAQELLGEIAMEDGIDVEIVTKVAPKVAPDASPVLGAVDAVDDFEVGDEVLVVGGAFAGEGGVVTGFHGYDHRKRKIFVRVTAPTFAFDPGQLRHRDFAVGTRVKITHHGYAHVKDAVVERSAFPRCDGYCDGMISVSWTGVANGGVRMPVSWLELDPESQS